MILVSFVRKGWTGLRLCLTGTKVSPHDEPSSQDPRVLLLRTFSDTGLYTLLYITGPDPPAGRLNPQAPSNSRNRRDTSARLRSLNQATLSGVWPIRPVRPKGRGREDDVSGGGGVAFCVEAGWEGGGVGDREYEGRGLGFDALRDGMECLRCV